MVGTMDCGLLGQETFWRLMASNNVRLINSLTFVHVAVKNSKPWYSPLLTSSNPLEIFLSLMTGGLLHSQTGKLSQTDG